jgi:hypothetical protein
MPPQGSHADTATERKRIMMNLKHSHLKSGKHFTLGVLAATLSLAGLIAPAHAYDSGSTGGDGAFSPTVNTELQIPESGVFNFTTVNIPTGVTVTFKKNTTNTPVVMLASGNVTVAGTINLNATNSTHVGASGDGNLGDDGLPGTGGPGGYDGGRGGAINKGDGGAGLGPGGGGGGKYYLYPYYGYNYYLGGGGGGYNGAGVDQPHYGSFGSGKGGATYGSSQLLPLLGGSGGGGGAGALSFTGSGGGGGGGAILISSSGTINVAGSISAYGGKSGLSSGSGCGARGGYGSGGAIRIVATAISGNGAIAATALNNTPPYYYDNPSCNASTEQPQRGGEGATGRIRLEAETFTRTAISDPAHSFGSPSSVFVAGLPTLRITSVAGVAAPANPTGNADITLPSATPNPVTVEFATTGVPVGNTVTLRVTPAYGDAVTVLSPAVTGTTSAGAASVSATLPSGPSVLSASTTYTIVTAMGEALSIYAQGETVEKVRLTTTMNGPTLVTLITATGKEFAAPHAALAMIGG